MDRIDKDNNGKVTQKELEDWIKFTAKRYVYEDVDRQWDQLKKLENAHMTLEERYVDKKKADPNEAIGWELYKNLTYGYITGEFNMEILISFRRAHTSGLDIPEISGDLSHFPGLGLANGKI